jgi:hypothetical protein
MGEGHYEVELRELLYEADGTGGLRVTGSMWKSVRVFNKNTVPMVLTFDALSAAQAYVGRNQPDAVRIVRATDDGEREVVEAGEGGVRGATRHRAEKNPTPK